MVDLFDEKENPSPEKGRVAAQKAAATALDEADFAVFWTACRKKVGKLDARKAYGTARRSGASAAAILAGLETYHKSKPEYADYCHPATFLRQGRWMDEVKTLTDTAADDDLTTFEGIMTWLGRAMRLRVDQPEFLAQLRVYRRVLRGESTFELLQAAEVWAARETRFPRPAEWKRAMTPRLAPARQMGPEEARDYAEAEACGWQRASCACATCVQASAEWRPQRFLFTDEPKVRDGRGRLVDPGHWGHGEELNGWWRAYGEFCAQVEELKLTKSEPRKRLDVAEIFAALAARKKMPVATP